MDPDLQNMFSNAQTLTAGSEAGIASTNWYKLGVSGRDIGVGNKLFLVVLLTTTMADAGSNSVLNAYLATDDNATGASPTNLMLVAKASATSTFAAAQAAGVAAAMAVLAIPPGLAWETYMGVFWQSTNGDLSAGAASAWITDNPATFHPYLGGFTIG